MLRSAVSVVASVTSGVCWMSIKREGDPNCEEATRYSACLQLPWRKFVTRPAVQRVEVFEDFLCPHSARLHQEAVEGLLRELGDKACHVLRLLPVNLLDKLSRPPGYSLRAAAIVVGLPEELRARMRKTLYANQPRAFDNADKFTNDRLIALGASTGIPTDLLGEAVADGTNYAQINNNLEKLKSANFGQLATPTVRINGHLIPGYQIRKKMSELLSGVSEFRKGAS